MGRADVRTNGQAEKSPRADPGIVRGSPDLADRKSSDNLELGILQFYSGCPMVCFKENYWFSKVSKGFHRFPRGVELFSGVGVKMLISIETYRTYDFPGAGGVQTLSHL